MKSSPSGRRSSRVVIVVKDDLCPGFRCDGHHLFRHRAQDCQIPTIRKYRPSAETGGVCAMRLTRQRINSSPGTTNCALRYTYHSRIEFSRTSSSRQERRADLEFGQDAPSGDQETTADGNEC
jgi:hypothetical protein